MGTEDVKAPPEKEGFGLEDRFTTLLFDGDDTLFDTTRNEALTLEALFQEKGLPFDGQILARYRAISREMWAAFERGEMEKPQVQHGRFSRLVREMGYNMDTSSFFESFHRLGLQRLILEPHALEVCRALANGRRLYLITNGTAAIQRPRLERTGLAPFFTDVFVSEELGVQKPQPAYFEQVLRRTGAQPENVLVIGDSLTSDIAGANAARLACCWYNKNRVQNTSSARPDMEIYDLAELL